MPGWRKRPAVATSTREGSGRRPVQAGGVQGPDCRGRGRIRIHNAGVAQPVGCEVVGVAATVTEALHLSEIFKPDLAIFDVRLTGRRDGIEGARLLRERSGLPVVFVSAHGDQPTRDRAAAVGPVDFLDKPLNLRKLIAAVEKGIRERQKEQ